MEKFTFFWSGPFSQWYPSIFLAEGKEFSCAEQYMMFKKAEFFGDSEISEKIMKTKDPREHKSLGRMVKNFDEKLWDENAKAFVYSGNYYKYTQNANLYKILVATSGTTLVEASPYDKIWGIGLREDDPDSLDRNKWKGKNWLGEVLTLLREDLINDSH